MEDFLSKFLRGLKNVEQTDVAGSNNLFYNSVEDRIEQAPEGSLMDSISTMQPRTQTLGEMLTNKDPVYEREAPLNLRKQIDLSLMQDKQRQLEFLKNRDAKPFADLVNIVPNANPLANLTMKNTPEVEQGIKIESAPGPASTGLPQQPSKFAKQVATVQSELDDIDQFEKERMAEEEDATGDEPVQAQAVSDPYADAVEDARRDKLMLALGRAGETIGRSMAGGGVVTAEKGDGLKALEPLVGDQLAALTDKQKLEFDKSKLAVAQLQQQNAETAADPNSQASALGRTIFANALKNIGMTQEAADILKNKPSLNQLEAAYGQYSLANAESREEAAKNRMAQLALTAASKQEAKELRKEDRDFRVAEKLRGEMKDLEKATRFNELSLAHRELEQAIKNSKTNPKSNSGALDIMLVYNFIKALDPESVVREGEVVLSQKGEAIVHGMYNIPKRFLQGQLFSDKFRGDILNTMKQIVDARGKEYNSRAKTILKEADIVGVDPNRIYSRGSEILKGKADQPTSGEGEFVNPARQALELRRKAKEGK